MTNSPQLEAGSEPEGTPLEIPAEIHDAMVAHCVREAPLECCGLLGGVSPVVSSIHPLRNTEASETRYNGDRNDLIRAVQEKFAPATAPRAPCSMHSDRGLDLDCQSSPVRGRGRCP